MNKKTIKNEIKNRVQNVEQIRQANVTLSTAGLD